MNYNGFDFVEIAQRFGILTEGELEEVEYDEDEIVSMIQDHITKEIERILIDYTEDNESKVEKVLREHLTALVEHDNSYQTPVWEGLLKVKDTFTFLKMCIPLIGYMWD